MSLLTPLKPQPSKVLSLLPSSPFSPSHSIAISPTLPLSRKFHFLSHASLSSSHQHHAPQQQHLGDDEDGDFVIGDCLVFEDGVFEDPYLQEDFRSDTNVRNPGKSGAEIEPENLVPESWKQVQAEINITKKERRKISQQLEFGRRVEKRKAGLVPLRNVEDMEAYESYRSSKLSQLKPLVLDNPTALPLKDEVDDDKTVEENVSPSGRVKPRNPRLAAYGRTLEDITELFNSESYEPGDAAAKKSDGPRKLFTKEEKTLLNRRIPNLAAATSVKWLPLHTLAASGEFYLVDALLKHNVDINATDKDGLSAIHKAIMGKKQAITNYLLRESANPFIRDKDGATLLHYAVRTASTQMIKILLLYNVDINLQDNDGWSPLHLAVQTRRTDLVRLLLIKGADKTLKNQEGLTPLDLSLHFGRDTRTYELIKLLKQLPKPREPRFKQT